MWVALAWAGISTLWCCPSSISSADHSVAHPPRCPEGWFWRGCHGKRHAWTLQVSVSWLISGIPLLKPPKVSLLAMASHKKRLEAITADSPLMQPPTPTPIPNQSRNWTEQSSRSGLKTEVVLGTEFLYMGGKGFTKSCLKEDWWDCLEWNHFRLKYHYKTYNNSSTKKNYLPHNILCSECRGQVWGVTDHHCR